MKIASPAGMLSSTLPATCSTPENKVAKCAKYLENSKLSENIVSI